MKRFLLFSLSVVLTFSLACCASSTSANNASTVTVPQKKESLALFPFTGGSPEDGEAIVSSLTRQPTFRDAFNRVTLITRNTIAAMNFEQSFQLDSRLTDADTIFELGKKLKAAYVIAGYITRLGNQNLVIVSILDVESLQQVAGDYRVYRSIEEIDLLIPDIAAKLAGAVMRDTSGLPGLSVPPFNISRDVNQNDAQVLAQMLSCDLANAGTYAVLPRTDSLEYVMEEHHRQREGATEQDQERVKRLGVGRNAQYVLSGSVQWLGYTGSKFAADILDIADGSFIDGYEESYTNFSQGFELIPKLAAQLAGTSEIASTGDNFVRIEGGTFQMGSSNGDKDERPVHTVSVNSFSMSKYPVTQKEWFDVMGTNIRKQRDYADLSGESAINGEGDNYPIYYVSWLEATAYCNKRSLKEGLTPAYSIDGVKVTWNRNASGYRLPTEAEWEYAAKGGNGSHRKYNYSGSNNVDEVAWYSKNSGGGTQEVGTKRPNGLGLYDMSGNVWEWCWDWQGSYSNGAQTDPIGAASGSYRVFRGGSWSNAAQAARSAYRGYNTPYDRFNNRGFRLVRNAN